MTHHILVAEPSNDLWSSITKGVRRQHPKATILRVKDGEQAVRLLFQQGLLMEQPETPHLIVLDAELPIVPTNALVARIRQHPRTHAIPMIIVSREGGHSDDPAESRQWLHRHSSIIVITGVQQLEQAIAEAMSRLGLNGPSFPALEELTGTTG